MCSQQQRETKSRTVVLSGGSRGEGHLTFAGIQGLPPSFLVTPFHLQRQSLLTSFTD